MDAVSLLISTMEGKPLPSSLPSGFKLQVVPRGTILIHRGLPIQQLTFLLKGRCAITTSNPDGKTITTALYEEFQIFGVAEWIAGEDEFSGTVAVASDSASILTCSASLFRLCLEESHTLSLLLNRYLGQLMTGSMALNNRQSFRTVKQTLMEYFYLQALSHDLPYQIPLSRQELAQSLRLQDRTLYRYLKQLEAEGFIENKKGKTVLTFANLSRLQANNE